MILLQKSHFQRSKANHLSFLMIRQSPEQLVWIKVYFKIPISEDPYRNQPTELQCKSIDNFLTNPC